MPPRTASDRRAAHRQAWERQRRARQAAWLLVGSLWLFVAVWAVVGTGGLLDVRRLESERAHLQVQLERVENANRRREAALEALESDPHETERLAREMLDYQRPGEVVYLLSEP